MYSVGGRGGEAEGIRYSSWPLSGWAGWYVGVWRGGGRGGRGQFRVARTGGWAGLWGEQVRAPPHTTPPPLPPGTSTSKDD